MTLDEVKVVFENKTPREVLINGLQHYLGTDETNFEILKSKFDNLVYKNITEPISYFEESISDIINNWNEYEWLYHTLEDETSRKTLCYMLMAKLTLDTNFIEKAFSEEPIYFSKNIWGQLSQETYIDCGAFDGDTVESFVLSCPDYAKIYAFEPVPEVMRLCENNLQDLYNLDDANIIYMNYAASDFHGEISFDAGTMNGESKQSENGNMKCKCIPLDFIDEANVSLIKMDIEGAEASAIEGAKKIIKGNAPKMALCIYHKPGDFWRIPRSVLNINSGYRFMIRQHDYEVYSETVLYCIPNHIKSVPKGDSNETLDRLQTVMDKTSILTRESYQNLLQHGKDKKWFLSQLRNQNNRIVELESWTTELERNRLYNESQIKSKDARITELERWVTEIEDARASDEDQIKSKNARIAELENWTSELEKVRTYDEDQIKSKDARIAELESWTTELDSAKEWFLKEIKSRDIRIAEILDQSEKQDKVCDELRKQNRGLEEALQLEKNKPLWKKIRGK